MAVNFLPLFNRAAATGCPPQTHALEKLMNKTVKVIIGLGIFTIVGLAFFFAGTAYSQSRGYNGASNIFGMMGGQTNTPMGLNQGYGSGMMGGINGEEYINGKSIGRTAEPDGWYFKYYSWYI